MEWKLLCGYLNGQYYIIIRQEIVWGDRIGWANLKSDSKQVLIDLEDTISNLPEIKEGGAHLKGLSGNSLLRIMLTSLRCCNRDGRNTQKPSLASVAGHGDVSSNK